jgi:hypothetical protein
MENVWTLLMMCLFSYKRNKENKEISFWLQFIKYRAPDLSHHGHLRFSASVLCELPIFKL